MRRKAVLFAGASLVAQPALHTDLVAARTSRRWSPRLGYAVAAIGSALVWSAIAAVTMTLI